MRLQVLGCAGGIGGRGGGATTSLLVDDDILIDAGTGIASLALERLVRIDHVFISHGHLDHVAGLAFLLDAVLGKRARPVTVHAADQVIAALKTHLFNWVLWPDFGVLPDAANPILRWQPMPPHVPLEIAGRVLAAHPVNHVAGSRAYLVHNGGAGFLFTGDMGSTPALWQAMRDEPRLRKVIVDCSFADAERVIAEQSMHFCPSTLIEDLRLLAPEAEVLIYHLKPGQEETIMRELRAGCPAREFSALCRGDEFTF